MNIISTTQLKLKMLIKELLAGKTVVYPTETCYGLGCDATNDSAVQKVFDIKKRESKKSVLVLMADVAMAKQYVVWNEIIDQIARRYWPGPVTVVATVKDPAAFGTGVVHDNGTIAFRVTSHPIAHDIVQALGKPLVSTSANISSLNSPYDIVSIQQMFGTETAQPDIVIDAGTLPEKRPSTIVAVKNGQLQILREGETSISLT